MRDSFTPLGAFTFPPSLVAAALTALWLASKEGDEAMKQGA